MDVQKESICLEALFVINPCRTDYLEYEMPDTTGMILYGKYSDGSVKQIMEIEYEKRPLTTADTVITFHSSAQSIDIPIQVHASNIVSAKVKTPPKTQYKYGEPLNLTGGVIEAKTSDGTIALKPMTEEMMGIPYDSTCAGTQTLIFKVGLCAVLLDVQVEPAPKEIVIESILIQTPPIRMTYPVGFSELNLNGGEIGVCYSDGSCKTVPMTDPEVTSHVEASSAGQVPVEIEYKGLTTVLMITLTQPKLVRLKVKHPPYKTNYKDGELMDLTGLILTSIYDNGAQEEISEFAEAPSEVHTGDAVYPVRVEQITAPIFIKVASNVPEIVKELRIERMPAKTEYFPEQEYDLTGLEIYAENESGQWAPIKEYTVDKKVASAEDTCLEVSYRGKTISVPVAIKKRLLENIAILKQPNTTEFLEKRDRFSAEGGDLLLTYNDGYTESIPLKEDMISNFSNENPGRFTLTVSYGGKETALPVTILPKRLLGIAVRQTPAKTTYEEGDCFDPIGMQIVGVYDNGQTLVINEYKIVPDGPLKLSDKGVMIFYMDCSTAVKISVHEQTTVKPSEPMPVPTDAELPVFYPSSLNLRYGSE